MTAVNSESSRPILKIKNLSMKIGSDNTVSFSTDNIDFEINRGETVGIVGESGSGKSITSMNIMRLIPRSALLSQTGEILWTEENHEINILELDDEEIRKMRGNKISMIFQEPMNALNPVQKCGKQVEEAILLHKVSQGKEAKSKVLELFVKVNLPEPDRIYNSYPHQLSGGQKQRVMIAMAISTEPDLLIADEPTTALDITVQKSILDLLKKIQKETGLAMIFITHDLGVVNYLSDKILVMKNGQIIESGPSESVINHPTHPYTKGLLACRPPIDNRPRRLLTVKDFLENSENIKSDLVGLPERKEKHLKLYAQEPLLRVENLKVWFPVNKTFFSKKQAYVKAVNDVSFNVYRGETLGLVGESGCGKSTLARAILQLQKSTEGKVLFNDVDLTSLNSAEMKKVRSKIQIIFQDPYSSLNPKQKIGDAIVEPILWHKIKDNKKEAKETALNLLKKVGLEEEHFDRYPHEFSGGQRQRINIARTIALQPELIICDESVSALDVSVQAQVLNLLNDLKDEFNLTYIFISHDLSVIRYMSDRVMVMNNGLIEELNEADEIYTNPQSSYTKELVSANLAL